MNKRAVFLRIVSLALSVIILSAPLAESKSEKLSLGLKVWYPDNWQKVHSADRLITRSPDGSTVVMFTILEADNIESAQEKMLQELRRVFGENIKVITQPTPARVNKLDGVIMDGLGMIGEVYVMWIARTAVYKNKALMVLGCVESSNFSLNGDIVRKIIQSVKR